MYQRNRTKYLLYSFVFLAATLLVVALFSLYFSDKTVTIKRQELLLAKKYRTLQEQVARKRAEYRRLNDSLEELKSEVGLSSSHHSREDLQKLLRSCTPQVRKLLLAQLPTGYPSPSRRITSPFGMRMHPIYHEERFHHGIDFGGAPGTPVHATCDGIVEYAGFSKGGYGNLVILRHNFGFTTLFGHMLPNLKVKSGEFVKRGEVIGYLGNSGLSTGPHLHYEIKYLRNYIDPQPFLHADVANFATLIQKSDRVGWQPLVAAITSAYQKSVKR